jgi:Holliday junction DNA helicase RuvA
MIARVVGELSETGPGYIVVTAGGVGYQLFVSDRTMSLLPPVGSAVNFYTKQIVRENDIALYGFMGGGERRLFELLLLVSGLGPKIAMSIIGAVGEDSAATAILESDWKTLLRAPGVGQKLAQKICVELQDKTREEILLGRINAGKSPRADDVVEALVSLGIKRPAAETAANRAREEADGMDIAQLIPIALKHAGRTS